MPRATLDKPSSAPVRLIRALRATERRDGRDDRRRAHRNKVFTHLVRLERPKARVRGRVDGEHRATGSGASHVD